MLIARMLDSAGFHCEWKTTGYEVVEFAETLDLIDLLSWISDFRMKMLRSFS